MAGLHAGLSPVEWAQESAPISRRWTGLHAIGAKARNGRANGSHARHLRLLRRNLMGRSGDSFALRTLGIQRV
jgi:hypothetical protein